MRHSEYLFSTYSLSDITARREQGIKSEIQNEKNDYIANVNQEEYLQYIQSKYEMHPPVLQKDKISCTQRECSIEKFDQFFSKTVYVDGIQVRVTIPFVGEKDLILAQASTWSSGKPVASIYNNELIITFNITVYELETFNINDKIKNAVENIEKFLSYIDKDLNIFNSRIKQIAESEIKYKIEKYKKISSFAKTFNYELVQNENSSKTYTIPTVEKKVTFAKPKEKQYIPEPILELNAYNDIIEICSNMATVMERSPKAFANMGEEDLRTHFLVQLNGQYQGQATGETFNSNGKTDILIRNENQNVFIAECKFWKGKSGYLSTIDQLLGYVTYRDTKTAIFMFVKNKKFTEIFNQMKEVIEEHPNFVKFIESYVSPKGSSAFRCEFKNQNDDEKHFYITIMAFCIPTEN